MKITINPGHDNKLTYSGSKIDPGAVGYGLEESQIALSIGEKVKTILESKGIEVYFVQDDSLSYICEVANTSYSDLFVSIHCNAFNGTAKGTECLFYPGSYKSSILAQKIQNRIVNTFGTVDRGIKERANLYVLNSTDMPATLVETAFIDNASDNELLKTRQDDFAKAISEGIFDYLKEIYGIDYSIKTENTFSVQNNETNNKPSTNSFRPITPEDLADYVAKTLIDSGVEGAFNAVTKSSVSDYPSIGCSQWLYDRADNLLKKIHGGNQFVEKTYSSIVNEGKMEELKRILDTPAARQIQIDQLKEDCLKYVNDLRQIWWLDDTRCLIYAATWATTSLSKVHKFIEWQRDHINIRSLLELTNAFASSYRSYFGVGEKYQAGYNNRAWKIYYSVAAIDLTSQFGIPEYGKGEFGK